ncbi:MAG: MFS transporter [Methanobacteriota archaeon]|nr:MAG: MFS transporter [Euryarchaeota archaeon]
MFGIFRGRGIRTHWHLRVLYFSTFFLRMAFGALLLLIAKYVPCETDYEGLLNVAIIAVPYPLAEMLTANYFGILSDRTGRKPIIVFGTAMAASIVLLYTLSNNVWYLAAMHGIHGIGAAATVAPAIAMIADHAEACDRGRQMGWFDYATFLGYIVGAVAGGFLIDIVGAKVGFLFMAGLLIISALMLQMLVKKEKVRVKSESLMAWHNLRKVFKIREVKLMFPIWLIIATLLGLAITYLPRIMLSEDISGSMIGLMFGAAGVALGLFQPFWGKVSDMVGRIPVMAYGVFCIMGIIIMALFFSDSIYTRVDDEIRLNIIGLIPLGILGVGVGAFVPAALALMADCSSDDCYGATMGLYSFALGFGAFIAESSGLGIIVMSGEETAVGWLLYFAAALIFLAVALMLAFFVKDLAKKWIANRGSADDDRD